MPRDVFGPRSGSFGGRSLEFEPTLMREISLGGRPRPRRVLWKGFKKVLVFLVLLASVTAASLWYFGLGDDRAVAEMATAAFQWVSGTGPEPFTADPSGGGLGLDLLFGGSAVMAESNSPADADSESLTLNLKIRDTIRASLEAQGVDWTTVVPLAFGGVRAQVTDPAAPGEMVVAVTGNIYFAAQGRVYALELSAERVDNRYVPTDLWQCVMLDTTPDNRASLEAHTRAGYEAFMRELAASPSEPSLIMEATPVFVAL